MSINEKLAVEVMGWTCEDITDHTADWVDGDGCYQITVACWNPIQDLNQLKMCYEALSDEEKRQWLEILESLLSEELGWVGYDDVATAWVKYPELVAQAILKAKGVS